MKLFFPLLPFTQMLVLFFKKKLSCSLRLFAIQGMTIAMTSTVLMLLMCLILLLCHRKILVLHLQKVFLVCSFFSAPLGLPGTAHPIHADPGVVSMSGSPAQGGGSGSLATEATEESVPGTHENSCSMTLPTDDQAVVPVPEDQPRSSMSPGFSQSMPVSDETEPSGAPSALPPAPEPQR